LRPAESKDLRLLFAGVPLAAPALYNFEKHCFSSRLMPKKTKEKFSLIPEKKLLALYAGLLKCRMVEESVGRGAFAGKEAPAVAAVIDLRDGDKVIAGVADFLPQFVKGQSPGAVPRKRKARSKPAIDLLRSGITASRSLQRKKSGNIAVVFCDAAGAATEKYLRAAGDEQLPVIFVRNGNPRSASRIPGPACGFPAITVDSDDVVAIYRVASESIAHARRGNGATLIECVPWPLAEEGEADAVASMERYLTQHGVAFERSKARVKEGFARKLRDAGIE